MLLTKGDEQLPLGRRLRERRQELGMTLKEVADRAGLSVGFISQVERDLTAPSLSSLVSICKILKTDVGTYLQQPSLENSYSRNGMRYPFALSREERPIRYERISANFPGRKIRSVIMNVPSGYRSEVISHDGEEMMFVLSGELSTSVDGNHVILHEGDSIHFPSTSPHQVWNSSQHTSVALWVGTQDLFGEDGKEN